MIVKFMNFLHDHWPGVVLTMTLILFLSALAGYWIQGITEHKWDMTAMWAGVTAIAAAAAAGYGKFWADSKYNSLTGQPPGEQK
ncbi:MAG: hypothetical protein ABFC84_02545 [Veillonellales bacterium]